MAESTTDTPPRSSAAQKAATTRKTNATKRSTSAKKAAETRAANRGAEARSTIESKTRATAARGRTTAAKKAAEAKQEIKSPIERASEIAEKAVLVPVGAALIARDNVVETIDELRATYATRTKARQELRRFERRGENAVKRIEHDAKKSRTRLERELRERRARLERDLKTVVKDIEHRADPMVKNVELVSARVENAVQTGKTAATKASTTVQERIAALV
jgi:hypothetical protein